MRPALTCGTDCQTTNKWVQQTIYVNEINMLKWTTGVTELG